jgi:large subunit ribosomal protein L29
MAILRKKEIKSMDVKILDEKLKDLKKELMNIRSKVAMGTVPENPGRIKEIKRTIAKIITMKKSKEVVNPKDE